MKKYTLLLVCALFCLTEVGATDDLSEDTDATTVPEEASPAVAPAVNSLETDAFLDAFLAILRERVERDPENYLPVLIQFVKFFILSNIEHLDSKYIKAVILVIGSHLSGLPDGSLKRLLQGLLDIMSRLLAYKISLLNPMESGKVSKEHPLSEVSAPLLAMVFVMVEYVNPKRLEKIVYFGRDICDMLKNNKSKIVQDSVSKLNKISSSLEDFIKCVNDFKEQEGRVQEAIEKGVTLDKYPDMENLKKAAEAADDPSKVKSRADFS
jgi:hypothetical protein